MTVGFLTTERIWYFQKERWKSEEEKWEQSLGMFEMSTEGCDYRASGSHEPIVKISENIQAK